MAMLIVQCDINNGITLCEDCHKNIHKQYGYNTKVQML